MLKKLMIIFCCCMFATGCTKQTVESTVETEETNILISQTDFSQSEAEAVVRLAVNNHCALDGYSCTIHNVKISGNDIIASYTYTETSDDEQSEEAEEITYIVGVHLVDVRVLSSNHSIVTIREKLFETPSRLTPSDDEEEIVIDEETEQEEEETEEDEEKEEEETTKILDLPTEEPDDLSASGEVVMSETGLKVYQIYINSGTITYTGSFDGSGTFNITAVPFSQDSATAIVSQSGMGEFSESASLESGWYYIIFAWDGGSYSISWSY